MANLLKLSLIVKWQQLTNKKRFIKLGMVAEWSKSVCWSKSSLVIFIHGWSTSDPGLNPAWDKNFILLNGVEIFYPWSTIIVFVWSRNCANWTKAFVKGLLVWEFINFLKDSRMSQFWHSTTNWSHNFMKGDSVEMAGGDIYDNCK